MWTIVYFEIDNSVDFIPDFWMNNKKGYCAWPKKNSNVRSFIENRTDPTLVPDKFISYKARILRTHISDINVARTYANKAQHTSDLSSHTDDDDVLQNQNSKKQKVPTPPMFNDYEECDGEDNFVSGNMCPNKNKITTHEEPSNFLLYNTPSTSAESLNNKRIKLKPENQNSKKKKVPTPPMFNDNKEYDGKDNFGNDNMCANKNKNLFEDLPLSPNYKISSLEETSNLLLYNTPTSESLNNIRLKLNTEKESYPTSIMFHENTLEKQLQDFQKAINRQLVVHKHEIKNIQDRLDIIINMQEKMYDKLCEHHTFVDEEITENPITCINSDHDLNVMEDKLMNDKEYKKKVVKEIARLRGQNVSETIRKIMQALFTDNFLVGFSYIGFKGERNFSTLQTCSIIFESIRQMKPFTLVTNIEVEKPLKNWLAQASNRLKKLSEKNNSGESTKTE